MLSPAHYERYVWCAPNPLAHAVYPNGFSEAPFGGFNEARTYLALAFENASDGHAYINWVYRPTTTTPREQCNGDVVWADGWIPYVSMPQTAGGGGGGGGCGRGAFSSSC